MTTYTLIAYRPNGVDTCRGCVMGTSDSDLSVKFFSDREALIEARAKADAASQMLDREYCDVEFTVLVDGRDYDTWWKEIGFEVGSVDSPFDGIEEAARVRATEIRVEAERLERERREAKERKAREDRDAAERAQYEKLHARYGA